MSAIHSVRQVLRSSCNPSLIRSTLTSIRFSSTAAHFSLTPSPNSSPSFPPSQSMSLPSSQSMDPVYMELVRQGMKAYEAAKAEVDAEMSLLLQSNKLVLFMEGGVDTPKSMRSLNVVKMLTHVQAVPLTSINMFEHPAILGYATEKCHKLVGPFLFKDGNYYGNHDDLLKLYQNSQLQLSIGTNNREKKPYFKGFLPIAMY